ncbi:MAG: class I SAM-dependent RNA methyltransferase [Candidatus Kerfeldbacteria bacterium]|nr:class I SAM-dependent RNA methyltransferase [Candidatus Kerfeldbacteria bacterium]
MSNLVLQVDKLVFGGQGLGRINQQVVFAWNALPGEQVMVDVLKKKRSFYEGVATTINQPSPHRLVPLEEHFLSCSPWQIISFDQENYWKQRIALATYSTIGQINWTDAIPIASDDRTTGYRNKMEFSFYELDNGTIALAFFGRGQHRRYPIQQCVLADPVIQQAANRLLAWINKQHYTRLQLKSTIIRSTLTGAVMVGLFVRERITWTDVPELPLAVYYSDPRSPAALPTELLYSNTNQTLLEIVQDYQLRYGLHSFFQVNLPLFQRVLVDIQPWLDRSLPVIDFYAGVGAISIPLAQHYAAAVLVESNTEAVQFAQQNITINQLHHCQVQLSAAEHSTDVITKEQIIIIDPPRAGLHDTVIKALLKNQPRRIIYLSCNISTQARDIQLLATHYRLQDIKLYNFFPRTPHIEGLCILDHF